MTICVRYSTIIYIYIYIQYNVTIGKIVHYINTYVYIYIIIYIYNIYLSYCIQYN